MSRDQHNYSSPVSAGRLFYRVVLLVVLLIGGRRHLVSEPMNGTGALHFLLEIAR